MKTWWSYIVPSKRLLGLIENIGETSKFVMSLVQFIVGMLNVWVPELNSLFQMEQHDDGTHRDQMRISFVMAVL